MSFFGADQKEAELSLILDIGSGSVAAAFARISRSEIPKILFTVREPLPFQEKLDPERLVALMEEALKKTCALLAKEGVRNYGKIGRIAVVLSSPWFISRTKTLSIENIKPFAFTRAFAEGILKADESAYEKEEDVKESEASILESQVISTKLNGYEIADPYGKRAQKAELSAYESIVPKKVIGKIRAALLSSFGPRDISFSTFPLVCYAALRDAVSESGDFMFIEISREVTEVSLVKKGVLLETSSFPFGKNRLVRLAESSLKTPAESALAELGLYFTGKVEAKHAEKIRGIVAEAGDEWTKELAAALAGLSGSHYLPEEIYLISQSDFLPFFSECANRAAISRDESTGEERKVKAIGHDDLKKFCAYGEHAHPDTFLAVGAIFESQAFRNPHSDLYYR